MRATEWTADVLGEGYEQCSLEFGTDPDGEGEIAATLVRRLPRTDEQVRGVALYVHGFSDYFFQTEMADFFAARGFAFHALDQRKCGRSRRPGQTAHHTLDLRHYDADLDGALAVIRREHPGLPVTLVAHSTGGLVVPLWLDRRRRAGALAPVAGMVLNSPWFDLQGSALQRGPITWALRPLARLAPFRVLDLPAGEYGQTLHVSGTGEWEFDLAMKPLAGCPVTIGWLNAIRRGHARLHRGLDVAVPSLVLHSNRTIHPPHPDPDPDRSDIVLDTRQIARWAGHLGGEVTVVPIPQARHDVLLSVPEVREQAYTVLGDWLQRHRTDLLAGATTPG